MRGDQVEDGRRGVILATALDLLGEVGFDRLTMDAVAARARASKATLYRHWAGKAELVTEALRDRVLVPAEIPDTGSVRGDLVAGLSLMVREVRDRDLHLAQGLLTALRDQPELAGCLRSQVVEDRCGAARAWIDREIARGTLPDGAEAAPVADVAVPMIMMRMLVTGEPVDEAYLERVVDEVVLPLLCRSAPPRKDHLHVRSNSARNSGAVLDGRVPA